MKASKKFYKKIDIIFWFVFMGLPIIVYLIRLVGISFMGNHLAQYSDLTSYISYIGSNNSNILQGCINDFSVFNMSFLNNMFESLFSDLNVSSYVLLGSLFGYMASIVFYHLLLDIVLFVPKFFHSFLRRVDKYEE